MRRIRILTALLLLVMAAVILLPGQAEEGPRPVTFRSAGDIVTLGHYEQDNNAGNGPEPIEWIILDMTEGRCLLISRYALDVMPYHTVSMDVTWEQCSLRSWLNSDFLDSAFSEEERSAIFLVDVKNGAEEGYPGYGTNGGPTTEDRIFLLSWKEAELYFLGTTAKLCPPTTYALSKSPWISGSYVVDGKPACAWWLRSPGLEQYDAIRVGNIASRRDDVSMKRNCVRPALWLNLNANII